MKEIVQCILVYVCIVFVFSITLCNDKNVCDCGTCMSIFTSTCRYAHLRSLPEKSSYKYSTFVIPRTTMNLEPGRQLGPFALGETLRNCISEVQFNSRDFKQIKVTFNPKVSVISISIPIYCVTLLQKNRN